MRLFQNIAFFTGVAAFLAAADFGAVGFDPAGTSLVGFAPP